MRLSAYYTSRRLGKVECNCDLFEWYPNFTDAGLFDIFEASTCANTSEFEGLYPSILEVDPTPPCTHVTFNDVAQVRPY